MEATIQDWLDIIGKFYMKEFIPSGGSAFKLLLTGSDEESDAALSRVWELAKSQGFVYAQVRASDTRIDKIDQVFFAVARQMDWGSLMAQDAVNFLRRHDYCLPEGASLNDTRLIAEANGREPNDLLAELRRATTQEIVRDRDMCKEFRTALAQLRTAQFFPRNVTPSDTEILQAWLRGDKVSLGALRNLRIYTRIARHNARDMLRALTHWIGKSLGTGVVIGLDLSGLLDVRPRSILRDAGLLCYRQDMVKDAYEVLRQFIDDTDESSHCLICAVAPGAIETGETRSLQDAYEALYLRLVNDVHPHDRSNLMASMVRLHSRGVGEEVS